MRKSKLLFWYFPLFDFIAEKRIQKNDLDVRDIHTHLVVMLTTGIFMWGYATVAYVTISSPIPGIVGYVCSLVHLLSPLIFRFSNNKFLATNLLTGAGMIHQATYAFFTGGFESHLLIWFGILPMIGGVICGITGAVIWTIITMLVSGTFLVMLLSGFQFPDLISPEGKLLSQAMLVFGWIFLSSSIVIVYAGLRAYTESLLTEQSQKIEALFRVLFHDLANPIGRISIGMSIARRNNVDGETNRGLEIIQSASNSMLEITQNVRKMYAASKGKASVELSFSPFQAAIDYVERMFSSDLEKKNLSLQYNKNEIDGLYVYVDPISFNNQVFGNIISNAIKFSRPGQEIQIRVTQGHSGIVFIEVQDKGIGIPESLLPNLFEISKKTSRQGTAGETGTGFGMNIMKSFVEMYGGEVFVESTENVGTTIKLKLKGEIKK